MKKLTSLGLLKNDLRLMAVAACLTLTAPAQIATSFQPYSAPPYWTEQYIHQSGAKSLALVFSTTPGVSYRVESTRNLQTWVLEDTYYGMGQDIAVSMLQMAAAPPTSTPPVMVDPDVVNLLMRPATTTGMVLNWLSLDDGSAQQHHFPSLTMGAIWFQNQNYCEVFDNLYFCISHPPLQAGPVTNTVHATRDSAMLMAFENHYVAMIAALEQSSAQQRLNPIAPVAPDSQSRKFFRITADWSLDSDGDLTPDWVEWMAMQGKEGLQAITTVTKPDGSSYQVNANPFSADANPDSSGGLAPLDCDGDTIADIEDADMTSKQVNWKKILATRYALFALPTPPIPAEPSVGVEPLQINSQGTVLFPRHAWKNDQLVTLQLSPSALQDLAQAYSINDSGNIFGVGYDYNTVPFVMKSSADPPVALRAAVDDIQITGQGSQFSAKPGITLKRKMGVFVELALSEVFDFGFVWW
jgi:hypothetical protein